MMMTHRYAVQLVEAATRLGFANLFPHKSRLFARCLLQSNYVVHTIGPLHCVESANWTVSHV